MRYRKLFSFGNVLVALSIHGNDKSVREALQITFSCITYITSSFHDFRTITV